MGRYSFFSTFALDVYAVDGHVSLLSNTVIASSLSNSSVVDDSEVVLPADNVDVKQEKIEPEEPLIEDFKIIEEQQEEAITGKSLVENEEPMIQENMMIQPFAFPTNNWGFSYQIDPGTFWISNYSDFHPKFRTLFMPIYNNFVDHVAGRINDLSKQNAESIKMEAHLNARIDSSNKEHGGLQTSINALTGTTTFLNARIDSTNSAQGGLQSQVNALDTWLNKRIDSSNSEIYRIDGKHADYTKFLNDRINSTNTSVGGIQSQVNALDSWLNKRVDSTNTYTAFLNDRIDSTNTSVGGLQSQVNTLDSWLNKRVDSTNTYTTFLNDRIDSTNTSVGGLQGQVNTLAATVNSIDLWNPIRDFFGVNDYTNNHGGADGAFTKLMKTQNKNILDSITAVGSKIDSLKTELTNVGNKIKDYTTLLTTLNLSTLANKVAIDNFAKTNSEDLTLINATLKGFKNYDDASFKKIFTNYFDVISTGYESGIVAGDGFFTKVIKGQFTRLIAELNRQLTLSFATTTNNIDFFKTYLREEFSLLNDWASLQVDWLKMINDTLLVSGKTLDKILAKPNGDVNVNVPPDNIVIPEFDYERLKEILSELSFGNVVNESGTNLWDVLKQLIDALGGVVESIIQIVPDLIDQLIGLIIPENRNVFSEKMNLFTGKFETKFEPVTSVTSEFTNVYNQPKNINSIQITIFEQDLKLIPDMFAENFKWLRSMLSAFLYLSTLVTCYKRIVGSGDVIE